MTSLSDRAAGVLIPLFSIRSDRGWGVGEFPDIGAIAPWLASGRFGVLMMLPLLEAALGQDSPYAALSAFALDPIYIALDAVEDFAALGGTAALPDDDRADLEHLREAPRVEYGRLRPLKEKWLARCFEKFVSSGAANGTARAKDLEAFRAENAAWLGDYALFRAIKEADRNSWWQAWEPGLRSFARGAVAAARAFHARAIAQFEYYQWLAYRQLSAARAEARRHGVRLAGDLPFMVAEDSADAWAHQDQFRFDATVGVPPDAYSADGQDWGLPVYRWDVMARRNFDWIRLRGERTAQAFDIVRVDHVVGFYRTYVRPRDKSEPFFSPAEEAAQTKQGEAVLDVISRGGVSLIAEDLGTVPPFVRTSLTRIGVPGFRVLRWEKDDAVFRDPARWPRLSVATTGTHDTEPIAVWWDQMPDDERAAIRRLPAFARLSDDEAQRFGPAAHAAILDAVYGSGSELALLPVQDIFGERERINLPGTMSAENWSYRMPLRIDALGSTVAARAAMEACAKLARRHGRAEASSPLEAQDWGAP